MRAEYDFSKGERGKFYRPGATLRLPVHLDETVYKYFSERAQAKGVDISQLINELLKKDIELIEGVK